MIQLTQEIVRELLDVDYETGKLYWKPRDLKWFLHCENPERRFKWWNLMFSKKEAFNGFNHNGYKKGKIFRKYYLAHRIIFLHRYGWLPEQIDHINGNRTDNRIINLRPATNHINSCNAKIKKNNTSGTTGVCFCKQSEGWKARINYKKKVYSKYFKNKTDAIEWREKMKNKFPNFTPRHGV